MAYGGLQSRDDKSLHSLDPDRPVVALSNRYESHDTTLYVGHNIDRSELKPTGDDKQKLERLCGEAVRRRILISMLKID